MAEMSCAGGRWPGEGSRSGWHSRLPTAAARLRAPIMAFGRTAAGAPVQRHTLRSGNGLTVRFLNYGGIITEILAPDRAGRLANVVLGYARVADYESAPAGRHVGALIGRYANRIAGGRFRLEGKDHHLALNDGRNALHGGERGFGRQLWTVTPAQNAGEGASAILRYTSPDGEEGYPGKLDVSVTYTVNEANEFTIRYRARCDQATVINLTHHGYFNLSGAAPGGTIHEHFLMVNAAAYLPVDDYGIPLGRVDDVAGTAFDFRRETRLGAGLSADHPQVRLGGGFDHNWLLTKSGNGHEPQLAARLHDPASGRVLECLTTEPGLQIYTRNVVHGAERPHGAVALETQHYPDSPNRPDFPNVVLRPGEVFDSTTAWRFSTDERFEQERHR